MNTRRIVLYLISLLSAGICVGVLLAVVMLSRPLQLSWLTVGNNTTETVGQLESYEVTRYGLMVPYPVSYHVLFDDSNLIGNPQITGDALYMSTQPISTTQGGAALGVVVYEFQRNTTEADRTAAIEKAQAEMATSAVSTVTRNDIVWTKVEGSAMLFEQEIPASQYIALIDSATDATQKSLIIARLDGGTNAEKFLETFEQVVLNTTLVK